MEEYTHLVEKSHVHPVHCANFDHWQQTIKILLKGGWQPLGHCMWDSDRQYGVTFEDPNSEDASWVLLDLNQETRRDIDALMLKHFDLGNSAPQLQHFALHYKAQYDFMVEQGRILPNH